MLNEGGVVGRTHMGGKGGGGGRVFLFLSSGKEMPSWQGGRGPLDFENRCHGSSQ